jgi:hypothetical protein
MNMRMAKMGISHARISAARPVSMSWYERYFEGWRTWWPERIEMMNYE